MSWVVCDLFFFFFRLKAYWDDHNLQGSVFLTLLCTHPTQPIPKCTEPLPRTAKDRRCIACDTIVLWHQLPHLHWNNQRKISDQAKVVRLPLSWALLSESVTPWTGAHQATLSIEIFLVRILEQVAISYSTGSSHPRNQTCISSISCIGRWILYHHATWEALGIGALKCKRTQMAEL